PAPDHHVLERPVQRVAHVQRTGDVRRRDDDAERLPIRAHRGPEVASPLPFGIPAQLGLPGVVGGGHFEARLLVRVHQATECRGTARRDPRLTSPWMPLWPSPATLGRCPGRASPLLPPRSPIATWPWPRSWNGRALSGCPAPPQGISKPWPRAS